MFPLRDHNPTELTPVLTVVLGVVTIAVWLVVQGAGAPEALLSSVCTLGAVPTDVVGSDATRSVDTMCSNPSIGWPGVLTSIFLHGGWMHLLGNMWFLWVFGNNIEDSMGHLRFLVFYLACGAGAAAAQIAMDPSSAVPMVGASGAISGVMGAYLVLYPKTRVDTLVGFWVVPLPAWIMLGYWFILQLTGVLNPGGVGGGVAYGAHVGGFVVGLVLIGWFRNPQLVTAKRSGIVLQKGEIRGRGWW